LNVEGLVLDGRGERQRALLAGFHANARHQAKARYASDDFDHSSQAGAGAANEGLKSASRVGTLRRVLRLAYIGRDGSTVELSSAERDRLLFQDRAVRREVLKWSRMNGGRGTLVLLHHSAPQRVRK
jgi:hypothetical protein